MNEDKEIEIDMSPEAKAAYKKAEIEAQIELAKEKIQFVDAFRCMDGVGIPLETFANYLICMNLDITPERLLEWLFKKKWLKRSKYTKVPYVTDYGWDQLHVSNDWKILPNGSMRMDCDVAITGEGQLEIVTELLKENYPKMFLRNGDGFINLRKVRESEKSKSDN